MSAPSAPPEHSRDLGRTGDLTAIHLRDGRLKINPLVVRQRERLVTVALQRQQEFSGLLLALLRPRFNSVEYGGDLIPGHDRTLLKAAPESLSPAEIFVRSRRRLKRNPACRQADAFSKMVSIASEPSGLWIQSSAAFWVVNCWAARCGLLRPGTGTSTSKVPANLASLVSAAKGRGFMCFFIGAFRMFRCAMRFRRAGRCVPHRRPDRPAAPRCAAAGCIWRGGRNGRASRS